MADYGYGNCPKCVGTFKLTKAGVMRHHLGDVYEGRWRQMCSGVGQPPKAEAKPISNAPDLTDRPMPKAEAKPSTFIDLEEALAAAVAALRPHATEPYGDLALGPARAAIKVLNVAAPILIAAGRAQAAADLRALIPRESTEIVDWLHSHKLGLAPGAGAVLSWLRYDMDALVASWAAAEGGGVADQSKDHP